MAEKKSRERTKRVNIRLSETMEDKASRIADAMGLPLSTLVTVAVGEYVASKDRLDRSAVEAARIQGLEMASMMDSKLTPAFVAEVTSIMTEEQLDIPLDQG